MEKLGLLGEPEPEGKRRQHTNIRLLFANPVCASGLGVSRFKGGIPSSVMREYSQMAFSTLLALALACAAGAFAMLLTDIQWATDNAWLMWVLWGLTAVFGLLAVASTKWWRALFHSETPPASNPDITATATGDNSRAAAVGTVEGDMHIGDRYYQSRSAPEPKAPPFVVVDFLDDGKNSYLRVMNSGDQPAYNVQLSCSPVGKFSFQSDIVPCLMPGGERVPVRGLTRIHSDDPPGDQLGWDTIGELSKDAGIEWNLREFIRAYLLGGTLEGDIFVLPEWQLRPGVPAKTEGHWHRLTFKPHESTAATVMPEGFDPPSSPLVIPPAVQSPRPSAGISPPSQGSPHPKLSGLAESLANQFLEATETEMPIQMRAYRDGLIIAAKQLQNSDKALSAKVVVSDIREFQDGRLKTTRMFHSPDGRFLYDAILRRGVSGSAGDLHYGDEGLWWMVAPNGYLQIFWPDRPTTSPPKLRLPPGNYIADLRIWVGDRNRPFQAAVSIDAEQRATISSIDMRH